MASIRLSQKPIQLYGLTVTRQFQEHACTGRTSSVKKKRKDDFRKSCSGHSHRKWRAVKFWQAISLFSLRFPHAFSCRAPYELVWLVRSDLQPSASCPRKDKRAAVATSKDASTRRPRLASQLEIKVTQSRRSSLGKEHKIKTCDVSAI